MNKLNCINFSLVVFVLFFNTVLNAQQKPELTYKPDATHIVGIHHDTIIALNGTTYSYTVDTPENAGLVSTGTTVSQLLSQITSKDGSARQDQVISKDGIFKTEGELLNGDVLEVKSINGKLKQRYKISMKPNAIEGKLWLDKNALTLNTTTDLILYFTAGQRSSKATINIKLPEGIHVNPDNTTVNVIGRGEVKLKDLTVQSIGRVGTNYTYTKVGHVAITTSANRGSVLTFKDLDLRPANGADLKIVIRNVKLSRKGEYHFSANYQTTEPGLLTSAGIGSETASLTVKSTITNFERIPYQELQYRDFIDTYTKTDFKWSLEDKTSQIQLMQSQDEGKTWQLSKAIIDIENSKATIQDLVQNKLYFLSFSERR